ncbi:MAG: cyclic nucleotide-binding domain-containing protein [Candidatus Hydrogenedentota bacterium]
MMSYEILLKHQMFDGVSKETITKLLESGEVQELAQMTKIFSEGDTADGFYFILEGQVGISKKDVSTNRETKVAILDAGETFGELTMIDPEARSATARTINNAKLVKISKEKFESDWKNNPEYFKILLNITKIIIKRLRISNQKLMDEIVWGKKEESESAERMINLINEKAEVRLLLVGERELIGKIKSIDNGLSGLPELILIDSTGHAFIIPFSSVQYIVKSGK